jgi:hypothetical protein
VVLEAAGRARVVAEMAVVITLAVRLLVEMVHGIGDVIARKSWPNHHRSQSPPTRVTTLTGTNSISGYGTKRQLVSLQPLSRTTTISKTMKKKWTTWKKLPRQRLLRRQPSLKIQTARSRNVAAVVVAAEEVAIAVVGMKWYLSPGQKILMTHPAIWMMI